MFINRHTHSSAITNFQYSFQENFTCSVKKGIQCVELWLSKGCAVLHNTTETVKYFARAQIRNENLNLMLQATVILFSSLMYVKSQFRA